MEKPTLPDETGSRADSSSGAPEVLALVVAWCGEEPDRIGEVLIMPPGDPGPTRSFGRGGSQPTDPHPRLLLVRDGPRGPRATPPLAIERISRVQLVLQARGTQGIEVRNVGQRALRHAGESAEVAFVRPGETIELGKQVLLLCVRRSAWLDDDAAPSAAPTEFGMSDATGIVGESQAVWELRRSLSFVASQSGHVLVLGASGTGKELAARALHALSPRASGPFVARSAATLPEGIIDAELFGNAKNYPNSGVPERPGLIGEADGGTLFLDEFAEISPALQAHLLRLLDGGEYHRLGESAARVADLRVVFATNRDESSLKYDLLARLRFRIHLPDLNTRREDIPLLIRHVLRTIVIENPSAIPDRLLGVDGRPRLSMEFAKQLLLRNYSTHVRELERLMWRSIESSAGASLAAPPDEAPPDGAATGASGTTEELSPDRIQDCLDRHNGALEPSWRALRLKNRHALSRLITKHGLEVRRRPGRGRTD